MNEKLTADHISIVEGDLPAVGQESAAARTVHTVVSDAARKTVDATVAGGKAVGGILADGARATGKAAKETAVLVGDLNDDGKLDKEDAKIAVKGTRSMVKAIAGHTMVKDAAAGAAIGALIAIPIPFMGPAFGAAIGAAFGVLKSITSRK